MVMRRKEEEIPCRIEKAMAQDEFLFASLASYLSSSLCLNKTPPCVNTIVLATFFFLLPWNMSQKQLKAAKVYFISQFEVTEVYSS